MPGVRGGAGSTWSSSNSLWNTQLGKEQSHLVCSTSACPALIRAQLKKIGMDCLRQHSQESNTHWHLQRAKQEEQEPKSPPWPAGSPKESSRSRAPLCLRAPKIPKSFTLQSGKTCPSGRAPEESPDSKVPPQAHSPGPGVARTLLFPAKGGFFMEVKICRVR